MRTPVKDYWNWDELAIDYSGDWRKHLEIERFLESKVGKSGFNISVSRDYPEGIKKGIGVMKVIKKYHYRVKDEKVFTFLSLKYS
jgi:hypothetical protein